MSYCVGILVDEGLALVSDSRTNAGIDRVSTFQKMFVFERPGERVFGLLTAGNLSITQSVASILREDLGTGNPQKIFTRRPACSRPCASSAPRCATCIRSTARP